MAVVVCFRIQANKIEHGQCYDTPLRVFILVGLGVKHDNQIEFYLRVNIPVILSMFHTHTIALSQIVFLQMYSHNGKSFDVNLAVHA